MKGDNMKKSYFIIICIITILVSLISFYFTFSDKEENKTNNIDKRSVVVYFSVTNNTEKIA